MIDFDNELDLVLLPVVAVALIAGVTIQCFFLRTLAGVLRQCAPESRAMSPGLVWLNLIPVVGNVWVFVTVHKISVSLTAEFHRRGLSADKTDFGSGVGFVYPVLCLLGLVPVVGQLFCLGGLICWGMYWRAMRGYAKTLSASRAGAKSRTRRPAFG